MTSRDWKKGDRVTSPSGGVYTVDSGENSSEGWWVRMTSSSGCETSGDQKSFEDAGFCLKFSFGQLIKQLIGV